MPKRLAWRSFLHMALAHVEALDDDPFTVAVARNIRALLAMRGMPAQELAERIGMKPTKLSQRLGGHTRWLGSELKAIADAFDISADVVMASGEQDFREALARSRCSSQTGWSGRHLHVVPDIDLSAEPVEQPALF